MRRALLLSCFVSLLVACGGSDRSPFVDADGGVQDAASDAADDSGGPGGPCTTPGSTDSRACGKCGTQLRVCNLDKKWSDWSDCTGETGACVPGESETAACEDGRKKTRTCDATCTWGEFGECEGTPTCTPGETETGACGNCGSRIRVCSSTKTWSDWSSCTGEGECAAGATESKACSGGGTQTRTCSSSCTWGPYGSCVGGGSCTPGSTETGACGNCGSRIRVCSAGGTWSSWSDCTGEGVCAAGTTFAVTCPSGGSGTQYCDTKCTWQTTCTATPLDVIILFDTTGSFGTAMSTTNKAALVTKLVNPMLASKAYDVRIGVVAFRDIDSGDKLVDGKLVPSSSSSAIADAINGLTAGGGGDVDEGGVLALSEIAGGPVYPTSKPLVCPAGTILGGCFRTGAKKIVVMISDAKHHNAPNGAGGVISPYSDTSLATWASTASRLTSNAISVYALTDSTSATMWSAMQTSLGSTLAARVVSPVDLIGITDWSDHYTSLLGLLKAANPGL